MARIARFLVGLVAVGLIATACTTSHHKSTTSSPAPSQQNPAPASTGPGTGTGTATPTTTVGQDQTQPLWSSNPVTKPATGRGTLVAVRAASHDGYDRITFEFTGARPGYAIKYVPRVTQDASGAPVPLIGQAFMSIVFMGAQAHNDSGEPTYTGPHRITTDFSSLKQAAFAGDFEGYVSFGLGLDDRVGFRVLELSNPARIAIDVAN